MLPPRKIEFAAKKKERENERFRTFLKSNADEEMLDQQFLELHKEIFAQYDCSRCRNCCRAYHAELLPDEVSRAAEYLQMDQKQFVAAFLVWNGTDQKYLSKHKPCDLLQEDGSCVLGVCKPDNCVKYPYTDQPGRLHSLLGMLDAITVCPVAYEIWERLKELYEFR